MKVVYIAGSYRADTEWGLIENIRRAEEAAIMFWQMGWAVICPHKNTAHFGGLCDDEVWLEGDMEILRRCDAIYMCEGWHKSVGATAEYELAKELGLQIIDPDIQEEIGVSGNEERDSGRASV